MAPEPRAQQVRTLEFWVVDGTPGPEDIFGPEYYVVHDSWARRPWSCTCPHHVYRRVSCKHIKKCQVALLPRAS